MKICLPLLFAFALIFSFGCNKSGNVVTPDKTDSTKTATIVHSYPYTDTFVGTWNDVMPGIDCSVDTTQNARVYVTYLNKDRVDVTSNVLVFYDCIGQAIMKENGDHFTFAKDTSHRYSFSPNSWMHDGFFFNGDSLTYWRYRHFYSFEYEDENGTFTGKRKPLKALWYNF